MTTKKFMREMMGIGVSRNTARRIVRETRAKKLSNAEGWYLVCEQIVNKLLREMGFAAQGAAELAEERDG